jgi:hypothetical protein
MAKNQGDKGQQSKKTVGHHLLTPYPTDLNEPADILLAKMSGEDVPLGCCVHAAYQIQGVTLSNLFPDDHEHVMRSSGEEVAVPSDEKAKELLQQCKSDAGVRGPIADMIMKQLLAFVMAKLNEWLNTR